MGELINGRTPEAIKIGLRNMLEACGEMCGEDTRCLHDICPYDGDSWCNESILMGALAYIERLEAAQPKWISVEERLPEENVYYMVAVRLYGNRGMYTDIAMYDGELWVRDAGSYFDVLDKGDITHYMPLPKPPKEDAHG